MNITNKEFMQPVKNITYYIISVGFISFILAVLIYIIFARSLVNPIIKGVEFSELISKGDLTVLFEQKLLRRGDEIGQLVRALDEMKNKLLEIVNSVTNSAEQVASGSAAS